MRNLFSEAQSHIFATMLAKTDVVLKDWFDQDLVEKRVSELCFSADKAVDGNEQRMQIYSSLEVNPRENFQIDQRSPFKVLYAAIKQGLTASVKRHVDFEDTVSIIIGEAMGPNAWNEVADMREDSLAIAKALLIGASLLSSTLTEDREMDENTLWEKVTSRGVHFEQTLDFIGATFQKREVQVKESEDTKP